MTVKLLTPHFSLEEMTASQVAARRGINNTPSAEIIKHLQILCEQILEPARLALGPLIVSSGYRCKELNLAIGGSATSSHMDGFAADISPVNVSKMEFAKWVVKNCKFDQVILEFGSKNNPDWIHVSADPRNRGEIFQILSDGRGYVPITLNG